MTALAERRRRRTIVAAVTSAVMALAAAALFVVGVVTLSNSQAGEAVGVDDRPVVRFPATPNGVLMIEAASGELASVVVTTLLPEGEGGSVVTVPVDADTTSGLGPQRLPLNEVFDAGAIGPTRDSLEAMLSLSIERVEVVDATSLDGFLPPFDALDVTLPFDADDTSGGGPVRLAEAGSTTLTRDETIALLTSVDANAPSSERSANDVAVWRSIAALGDTSPSGNVEVDADGRPLPPASMSELTDRLWSGPVSARGLLVSPASVPDDSGEPGAVVIDSVDITLVFAQISPSLVSTPNVGATVRLVVPFTEDQLALTDGLYDTTTELLRSLLADMELFEVNVVSIDSDPSGAADVTVVEVTDERSLADIEASAPLFFGEAAVRVADDVLEGVDLRVELGMTYLIREMVRADDGDGSAAPPATDGSGSTAPPTTVGDDE